MVDGKAGCEGPALEVGKRQIEERQFLLAQVLVDQARDTQDPSSGRRGRSSPNGSGSSGSAPAGAEAPHRAVASGARQPGRRRQGSREHAEGTVPEREYKDYTLLHPGSISDSDEPDVLLDVPVVNVDEIHFELDNLHARVSLHAEVLDLVRLSVGVHAELGKVELDIKGVEAQALLRVRLDHVTAIIDRVLTTLDRNPKLVESLGRTVEQLGSGASHAVEDVGEGAGRAPSKTSAREPAVLSRTSARAPVARFRTSAREPARPSATSVRASGRAQAKRSARSDRAPGRRWAGSARVQGRPWAGSARGASC